MLIAGNSIRCWQEASQSRLGARFLSFPTSQRAWDVRKSIYINGRNSPNEEWRRENSFITRSSPPPCSRLDFENLLQTDSAASRGRRQHLAVTTKPHIFLGEINIWSWRMYDLYLNIIPDLTGNHFIKTWWCDEGRLVHVVTSPLQILPWAQLSMRRNQRDFSHNLRMTEHYEGKLWHLLLK